MTSVLIYLGQSSICLLAFALVYWLILKNESCYTYRRLFLLIAMASSLSIPIIDIPPYTIPIAGLFADTPLTAQLDEILIQSTTPTVPWLELIAALFWSGVMINILRLIFKYQRVQRVINEFTVAAETYKGHHVHYTEGKFASSSYFKYLLWDNKNDHSPMRMQFILDHELVHIRQGHSWDIMAIQLFKSFFWFNPLLKWYHQEFEIVHEFIADSFIVKHYDKQKYVALLAEKSLAGTVLSGAHYFNKNQTIKRITMILKPQSPTKLWKYLTILPVFALLFTAIACDPQDTPTDLNIDSETSEALSDNSKFEQKIYVQVDQRPDPKKGMDAFYRELSAQLEYPAQARRMGIEGKVYVEFIVQANGVITDMQVLEGIGAGCDAAAVAALSKVDDWNPGVHRGEKVAVKMVLPIQFKLG